MSARPFYGYTLEGAPASHADAVCKAPIYYTAEDAAVARFVARLHALRDASRAAAAVLAECEAMLAGEHGAAIRAHSASVGAAFRAELAP